MIYNSAGKLIGVVSACNRSPCCGSEPVCDNCGLPVDGASFSTIQSNGHRAEGVGSARGAGQARGALVLFTQVAYR